MSADERDGNDGRKNRHPREEAGLEGKKSGDSKKTPAFRRDIRGREKVAEGYGAR